MTKGETIMKLAVQAYGSKSFAKYIDHFNKLSNPDVIPLGTVLKLPELKKKNEETPPDIQNIRIIKKNYD